MTVIGKCGNMGGSMNKQCCLNRQDMHKNMQYNLITGNQQHGWSRLV